MSVEFDAHTIWILGGIVLLILEMLSGTFVLMFVALGFFAAGLCSSLNRFGSMYGLQAVICAVVSILGVLLLRKPIQKKLLRSISLNADIGKEIQVTQEIAPHQTTRITYQGTNWYATNLDSEALKQGDRVEIVGIDGNVLLVRKVY